ncbi:hypothetical protein [Desulfobacter sp.]|jgi:hypothetical protein|uniref:hypothetical protein n=1 Tax=Desulfobacter sp. TaxID=2294 RepID=UPI000E8549FD|nr:hypothetical protein [Desulfobacter sp.]HBT87107.1 hypothetical protein [Desulfobacter sp.]
MKPNKQHLLTILILLLTSSLLFSTGHGASVLKTTMDEMLTESEFVFEGRVLSVESRQTDSKRIHTFVTFEIQEIIKGEYPEPTITLRFLGGTVGNLTMVVSDIQFPRDAERGVYFVESLERNQVHPLYGWSQGHFTVTADDTGTDRMMTAKNQPVTGLSLDAESVQQTNGRTTVKALSTGTATGVTVEQNRKNAKGLPLNEFKQALRKRLNEINQ